MDRRAPCTRESASPELSRSRDIETLRRLLLNVGARLHASLAKLCEGTSDGTVYVTEKASKVGGAKRT